MDTHAHEELKGLITFCVENNPNSVIESVRNTVHQRLGAACTSIYNIVSSQNVCDELRFTLQQLLTCLEILTREWHNNELSYHCPRICGDISSTRISNGQRLYTGNPGQPKIFIQQEQVSGV